MPAGSRAGMELRSGALAAVAAALAATLVLGAVPVAGEPACTASNGQSVCLDWIEVSDDRLAAGESATLEATVRNADDEPANATVVLNTAGPDNVTNSYTLGRVRLAPGETHTISQSLDASTPGTHGLQVLVFDGDLSRRHDASTVRTLVVTRGGLGGAVDRDEYALAALVGSVGVAAGLVYRRR